MLISPAFVMLPLMMFPASKMFPAMLRSRWILCMWALEAFNYGVHVIWRPIPWNLASQLAGYTMWSIQLMCFFRCQLAPAPEIDATWLALASNGTVPSRLCKKTNTLIPPRARHVRSAGGIVLGFDHVCTWIGTPIGVHNRKYFLLFVWYSALFCIVGSAHSIYELTMGLPSRLFIPTFPWKQTYAEQQESIKASAAFSVGSYDLFSWHLLMSIRYSFRDRYFFFVRYFGEAYDRGMIVYAVAIFTSVIVNVFASLLLTGFFAYNMNLAMRNRTTLDPDDSRFDVGIIQNLRQIFGSKPWLWALPVHGAGSLMDDESPFRGHRCPLNPRRRSNKKRE